MNQQIETGHAATASAGNPGSGSFPVPHGQTQFSQTQPERINPMTFKKTIGASLLATVVFACAAQAESMHSPAPYLAEAAEWGPVPPVLPAGAEIAVLSGNPFAEGWFVLRLNLPAGYDVPAHIHSGDELITVISGEFNIGHGDKLDRDSGTLLTAGGFVELPAGHPHFAWTGTEAIVQIHGPGPFDITYIDPADNPVGQ